MDGNEDAGSPDAGQAQPEASPGIEEAREAIAKLMDENAKLAALSDERLDALRRSQAEFDNFRKRTQREKEELTASANARLLSDLLTTLDDLDRALGAKGSEDDLRSGLAKVRDNLLATLKSYGLVEVPSGKFDPAVHEALAVGEGEDGEILEVYQKGWFLGTKVLRCSKVKVARKGSDDNG